MKVNGETVELASEMTVSQFLESKGYDVQKSAVLLNGNVVPRAKMGATALSNSDNMEIVSFVGGG